MLKDKNILIGITGSIAAYKAAELVRLFKKSGASVKVIQTEASLAFVSPLTLSTLSENPVLSKMVDLNSEEWNNHVELGLWADIMVISPATSNTMAKMSNGVCDNLLLATYLSAKCPVYFAPAMDLDMYKHPATSNNISKLESFGNNLIPSGFGELASGLFGEGRMAEPIEIIQRIKLDITQGLPMSNLEVLITAGPTQEAIDPVRFIGNRSSGRMGIELAIECANNGAKVNLVLGPTHLDVDHSDIYVHKVISARHMYEKVDDLFVTSDISIFTAAVADYTPKYISKEKIKKSEEELIIPMIKTKDIIFDITSKKSKNQFVVGFALETESELSNAKRKLEEKKMDMIVLNSLKQKGAGFNHKTNKITIIDKQDNIYNYNLKEKSEVAKDIVIKILEKI